MHCTLNSALAVLLLNLFCAGDKFVDSVFCDNLETDAHVGHHVLGGLSGLAIILLQETSCCCWSESAHLHLTDHEATSVKVVHNLASVHVGVWLNQ